MRKELEPLLTPWKIGNVEIKNRIVLTSMGGTDLFGWMEKNHFDKDGAKFILEVAKNNCGLLLPGCQPVYNPMFGQWLYKNKKMFNYNNGQISEWLVKDKFCCAYQRDNLPYYYFGDMQVGGNTYQIKSHKATFCTLSQLQRYINRYGLKKYYSYDMTVSNNTEIVDIDYIADRCFNIDMYDKIGTKEERWYICANDEIKNKLLLMTDRMFRENSCVDYWNLTEIANNNGLRPLYLIAYLFDEMD